MFYNAIKVTKMMDGVYEMKEFDSVTLWLIEGDDKCLLIDTGMGLTDLPATIAGITDKPIVVVNSHIHIDHVGGNGQFPEVMCGRFDEPYAHIPLEVEHVLNGGPLDALLELRDAGKIGHIGITSEEPWTVIPFLEHETIEVYQIAYNIIYQAAARHFLIEAGKANAGVVTMRTMTSGIFQREMSILAPEWQSAHDLYEVALKFVLSDSRVHAGIVGMRWPHEVEQNVRLLEGWEPPVDFATMPRLTFEVYKAEDAKQRP